MYIKEKLKIENFFSIASLEWEPKEYNVITGEMGSGKSLCLKLLYFIYEIFNTTIFESSEYDIFTQDAFYTKLKYKFEQVFEIDRNISSVIDYFIKDEEDRDKCAFDFSIRIQDGNITFSSNYIDSKLENWRFKATEYFKQNHFDSETQIKDIILRDITSDIGSFFPFGQMYFSDFRALMTEPNMIIPTDEYTREMLGLKGFLDRGISKIAKNTAIHPVYQDNILINTLINKVYKILHIKEILDTSDGIYLLHNDNRKTPVNKCSSGQREIFHLLNFIILMKNSYFSYSNTGILFIEEPEVHLFPCEQKLLLELIGEVFNILNKDEIKWRFFITTHSPYLLNVFNNMLFKGSLLKEYQNNIKKINEINAEISFADFNPDKVSAIFLKHQEDSFSFIGNNIIEKGSNSPFLFSKEIENITYGINNDYNNLDRLKNNI